MDKLLNSDIEIALQEARMEKKRLMKKIYDADTKIGHLKIELEKRKEEERRRIQSEYDAQRMGR